MKYFVKKTFVLHRHLKKGDYDDSSLPLFPSVTKRYPNAARRIVSKHSAKVHACLKPGVPLKGVLVTQHLHKIYDRLDKLLTIKE